MLPHVYEQYFGNMQNYWKHPNLIPLRVAQDTLPLYAGLDLIVLYNNSSQKFITSDVPVVNINPYYEKRKYSCNFGLASMGLQKFLPISSRVCLCLYDRNAYINNNHNAIFFINSKNIVRRVNQIIAENAYEQIFFSPNEDVQYIRQLCSKRKKTDEKSSVIFYGKDHPDLIQLHRDNLRCDFLLPCFSINRDALRIELPTHMAGLIRPELKDIIDEYSFA